MIRLFADFQNATPRGRVRLTTVGTFDEGTQAEIAEPVGGAPEALAGLTRRGIEKLRQRLFEPANRGDR